MKNLLIASAAAVAMMAVASTASAQVGYVGVTYSDSNDIDANDWTFNGAVALPAGPLNVQLDGNVGTIEAYDDHETHGSVGAHVFHRNETFAVGVAASAIDEGVYTYGVEGAFYLPQFTLSAGWTQLNDQSEGGEGEFANVWNLGGKFFATDNFSVGLNYANVDTDFGDGDAWGAEVEYKFNAPVSVYAAYTTADDADVDLWSIGARWHFGAATLKEQDRNGASMGANNSLLNFLF